MCLITVLLNDRRLWYLLLLSVPHWLRNVAEESELLIVSLACNYRQRLEAEKHTGGTVYPAVAEVRNGQDGVIPRTSHIKFKANKPILILYIFKPNTHTHTHT